MGHVKSELLTEFLQLIDLPLFCNDKKAEELIFDYDKDLEKIGLYIDGVLIQLIPHEVWARFSC